MLYDALRALQEELRNLKSVHGTRLRIVKSKGDTAPFPITVRAEILTPEDLYVYDVSGFQVILRIEESSELDISVRADELPAIVQLTIAQMLRTTWESFQTGQHGLQLGKILDYAQSHVKELITSHPDLIESYESVDSNGTSVRRFMLNDPSSRLEPVQQALGRLTTIAAPEPSSIKDPQATPPASEGTGRHPLLEANSQLSAEIAFLQRRFRSALITSPKAGTQDRYEFELRLSPTDPSWPKELKLSIAVAIAPEFPNKGSVRLTTIPKHGLDPDVCLVMDKIITAELQTSIQRAAAPTSNARQSYILGELARQLENSAGEYLNLAEDVVAQQRKKATHREAIASNPKDDDGVVSGSVLDLDLSEEEAGDHSEESTAEEEWRSAEDRTSEQETDPAHTDSHSALHGRVLMLELEHLKLDNVDAVDPLMLNIQLATSAVSANSLAGSGDCPKCSRSWSLDFRPVLAHAYNSIVAHLRPENCRPVDLTPSLFACQCGSCSSVATFKEVQVGTVKERNCSSCHLAMSISFSAVGFKERQQQNRVTGQQQSMIGSAVPGEHPNPKKFRESQLVPGTPLPAKGTCKHYPHSYRWLRFPCCGRRYPCDLCHEEDSDGHHMKWAHRHVCGFCSTEQKIEDRCSNCNKPLAFNSKGALGSNTRHWEGGQGCRDKKRLDRRDKAKYRNSKAKSVSKKAFRVGEAGARQRRAKQDAES